MILERLKVLIDGDTSGLEKAMGKLGIAISAGALFRSIVKSSEESQAAMAQLEAAVRSTGGAAGYTTKQLDEMSVALQKQTAFGDEAIKGAESLLLTFTRIRGPEFKGATKAVLDMATAMAAGSGAAPDLKSASIQVGKALNDPIKGVTALQKVGVSFTDSQKDVIKSLVESGDVAKAQGIILKELETEFGGSAAAARNTLGGALRALGEAWGDQLEISQKSSSGVIAAIEGIITFLPKIRQFVDFVVRGWQAIGINAAVAAEQLKLAAMFLDPRRIWSDERQAAYEEQKKAVDRITEAAGDMMVELNAPPETAIENTRALTESYDSLATAASKAYDAIKKGSSLGLVMQTDPNRVRDAARQAKRDAERQARAEGGLTGGFLMDFAKQKPEFITPDGLKRITDASRATASIAEDYHDIGNEVDRFTELGTSAIVDFTTTGADAFKTFADSAIHEIERILAKLLIVNLLKTVFAGASGGFGLAVLNAVQGRADYGHVQGGRPYIVGERRAEMFVPTSSGQILPAGSGGGPSAAFAAALAAMGPVPRAQTPREVSQAQWYRELFVNLYRDHQERR